MTSSHPTVTIISPTPRAFQFPINVNDPYASPSSSPFEPDLKGLSFTPPPPRPLSPTSSINSDSSSLPSPTSTIHLSPQHTRQIQPPALPKRRKSLGGDPVERRPRKGDEDYIKRPENAFILFRRKCCEERNGTEGSPRQRQRRCGPALAQGRRAGDESDLASETMEGIHGLSSGNVGEMTAGQGRSPLAAISPRTKFPQRRYPVQPSQPLRSSRP